MKRDALVLLVLFADVPTFAQTNDGIMRDALAVQKARNAFVESQKTKHYYKPGQFDLSGLPAYVPEARISGPIRIWVSDMWGNPGFQQRLEAAFRKYQPDARFEYTSISPSGAFAGLLTGNADVAIARRMTWVDVLSYERRFDRDPIVIAGMTGWWVDPPFVIAVHKGNPIASLSLDDLDRIFGAERSGGWKGASWHPEVARGPERNARVWGQLGLSGEWKNRPIDPYGYNLQYLFAPRFSNDVLEGSGQWNEHLRQFTISATADGKLISVDQQMAHALGRNRQAIAYYAPGRADDPDVRAVPIRLADGRVVAETIDTVRDHSYPLFDNMWFYATRDADGQVPPKVREFLRFILSRDAQEEVNRDTTMLPLTLALAKAESTKLDSK
jgi:phosphate transport system substrate-binding protein